MRGLVLENVRAVSYRTDLPDPGVVDPTDAVVAVRRAGLCGSDLHPYEGREAVGFGIVAGHEVVGDVVATGSDVTDFRSGDHVIVPFTTSCGACGACREGLSARCRHGGLFGFAPPEPPGAPGLDGGQAEFVRVPLADGTLVAAPEGLADPDLLLLADNGPTGWYAAERAGLVAGGPVAVVGVGAVGLCALVAARVLGAGRLLAVDPVEDRRRRAETLGAVAAHPDDAGAAVRAIAPDGVTSVIEAAGTPAAQALACALLRPGGTLSTIAVPTDDRFGFAPGDAYDLNLTVRAGRAPVRSILGHLVPRLMAGEWRLPTDLVLTHPETPLSEGPETYRRFAAREPGLVKAAFVP